jgi:hypothetical protein
VHFTARHPVDRLWDRFSTGRVTAGPPQRAEGAADHQNPNASERAECRSRSTEWSASNDLGAIASDWQRCGNAGAPAKSGSTRCGPSPLTLTRRARNSAHTNSIAEMSSSSR